MIMKKKNRTQVVVQSMEAATCHAGSPSLSVRLLPLQIWLPAHVSGKVTEEGPDAWTPATHEGDQLELLANLASPVAIFGE